MKFKNILIGFLGFILSISLTSLPACKSTAPQGDHATHLALPTPKLIAPLIFEGETHFKNMTQLTDEGTNAEAYWSFDGQWLTFQHSGQNYPCDQIFKMKFDGSERSLVSTGKGRTTCSYFTPNDQDILYSSTHHDSAECPPSPDKSKGYVWPIYPTYDFFITPAALSKNTTFLEKNAPHAYNAEATTCKDGSIIFTSDRNGDLDLFTGKLVKTFKSKQSSYTIKNIKQVTHLVGYDGGAFFSPDCSKIVWRASRPKPGAEQDEYLKLLKEHLVKPSELEIWVADRDGSHARQVTYLKGASFAPYMSPDHQSILFASNFENPTSRYFNIYKIDVQGTRLEQITHSASFDSFPMFSPDGKKIAFSSNRFAKKPRDTNVFVADWIEQPKATLSRNSQSAVDRFAAWVEYLSQDALKGRGLGTPELTQAEDSIVDAFKKMELTFLPSLKGYKHSIQVQIGQSVLNDKTYFIFNGNRESDFLPTSFSSQGSIQGNVVDCHYGLPKDFDHCSVKNKIVLIKRFLPKNTKLTVMEQNRYSDLKYKTYLAREAGALGVLFWDDSATEDLSWNQKSGQPRQQAVTEAGLPVAYVQKSLAKKLLSQPSALLQLSIELKKDFVTSSNILGVLEKTPGACQKNAPIVIGAHLDHLGLGSDNSLEPTRSGIHHGADDNASGVVALLEVAKTLKS